jgi:DNA polymerase-3 subunit alpha
MRYEGGQYFVKSEDEMRALFPYALEAIENTQKIADRCNVDFEFHVTKLPKYDVPDGYTAWEYLNKLCFEGLHQKYENPEGELTERLTYELNTIKNMGYVDYFLIVWDFINYARTNGIMVGPGRGSAAGSIVSYTLGITNIDPIKYQLLFERFLNPERVSMPDIDIDFCYERRQEVIDYVVRKYGAENVAQIVTFGTLKAKAVVRDVGRVMDLPYALCDSISKMIPNDLGMTLDKALDASTELRELYQKDEQVQELIEVSKRLEGLPRHSSMHAAGVVICQEPVDEYVPLSLGSDGSVTTQFVMTTLEELGLLKMDFLGLRTLTVIRDAIRLIEKNTGKKIDIDHIDYNDKAVLDSIGTGKTDGVFQLESAGMKSFMKELKPQSLEDIIAGIALYRPGPMDFIPQYIKGKNDQNAITYDCPQLEPILKATYGCIVYQEQVMQIVRDLAGYTLGRSDLLRRAMSKKKADVMEKERQNFVYGNPEEGVPGCIANGIHEATANKIYDEMIDFAKYAFNKSHAAAYAIVSYQTAYLKHYYPVEFMAALMTSVIDNAGKVAEYIYTCRQMGIKILPPDINTGEGNFSVSGDNILYGLSAIKSVGRPVIEAIVAEREKNGPFKHLKDFIERLTGKEVNKRTIESFIKAGALDCLGGTRKQFMMIYIKIVDQVAQEKKYSMTGQMTLFDMVSEEQKSEFDIPLPNVGEYEKETMLAFEKEVLGIYVSGHPMEEYEAKWKKSITATTMDFQLDEETGHTKVREGERAIIGGMIAAKTIKYTKTNKTMAFLSIEDLMGTVEVMVFPRDYEKSKQYLNEDAKVFVKGRVSEEDGGASKLICETVIPFEEVPCELWIQFADIPSYQSEESNLFEMLKHSEGTDRVVIYCAKEKAVKRLSANRNIHLDADLLMAVEKYFGKDRVKVVEKQLEKV